MPEYLAPGVYVEEVSFRSKSIEGVSTSTTGFVGPTRSGPTSGPLELLTSFPDFERIYGSIGPVGGKTNYLAHAVRAFFNEGGARLFVARVFKAGTGDGKATSAALATTGDAAQLSFVARFPGDVGNGTVKVTRVTAVGNAATLKSAVPGSVLEVTGGTPAHFIKQLDGTWKPETGTTGPTIPTDPTVTVGNIVTLEVATTLKGASADSAIVYEGLGLHRLHPRYVGDVFGENPTRRADAVGRLFALRTGTLTDDKVAFALVGFDFATTGSFTLTGGNDGADAAADDYDGPLDALGAIDDISIIAAPGSSASTAIAKGVRGKLIAHAEKRKAYRIAVLDAQPNETPSSVLTYKNEIDSSYAALYYPWIQVPDPLGSPGSEISLPPSGQICGIYARTDIERAVYKSPANEVVVTALRFERDIAFGEQELLNPRGVNCLRFFPGRGYRVWGARTASSDPEWKYVSVRRYFLYLERSIDVGTQWAVFEPNGEKLWANIRETISSFLYNEWRNGALLGTDPKEAFFVQCDRTTMDQNDLDNGRLVCLVGVAVVKPAEFVIFRIGQKTADARN